MLPELELEWICILRMDRISWLTTMGKKIDWTRFVVGLIHNWYCFLFASGLPIRAATTVNLNRLPAANARISILEFAWLPEKWSQANIGCVGVGASLREFDATRWIKIGETMPMTTTTTKMKWTALFDRHRIDSNSWSSSDSWSYLILFTVLRHTLLCPPGEIGLPKPISINLEMASFPPSPAVERSASTLSTAGSYRFLTVITHFVWRLLLDQ